MAAATNAANNPHTNPDFALQSDFVQKCALTADLHCRVYTPYSTRLFVVSLKYLWPTVGANS